MKRSWVLLLSCMLGCSPGETRLVVHVTAGAGVAVKAVDVSVFDDHGVLAQSHVEPATLPGVLTVRGFAAAKKDVRVVGAAVIGFRTLLGGARATIEPHATTTAMLVLDVTPDRDGDGVPDALDDCPDDADPLQESSAGGAPGDACRGGDAGVTMPDLASAPPPDLAGDMAGVPPPDLAMPPGSTCASAGLLFCDGFESGLNGAWSVNNANGTIGVDATRAYRGTHSVKAHNNAMSATGSFDQADIVESATFAAGQAPTHFFVRAFVYVPSTFGNTAGAIFIAGQAVPPYSGVNLQIENGELSSYNNLVTPAISKGPVAPAVPKDQWVCLEWEIDNAGTVNVWTNGTLVPGLSGAQSVAGSPAIGVLGFGLLTSAAANLGARDLWLDEIAVDGARVTCAK